MFASVVTADYVYQTFVNTDDITDVIAVPSIGGTMVAPPGTTLPALLLYMTASEYGGVVDATPAADVNSETIRLEVRAINGGTSDAPVYPVAKAQFTALAGQTVSHTFDGDDYTLTFMAVGEVPLTTLVDGANLYRQLGTIYTVDVFRG